MSEKLVVYFSASGVTRRVADALAEIVGADIHEIKPKTAYTAADLDWHDANSRSSLEMKDERCRPEMADDKFTAAGYQTIFLGFPIWWYEAPRIIHTYLESDDFSGKTIVLFATSGGSSWGETLSKLKPACPQARWIEGKVFHGFSESAIRQWVDELKL